jgi:glycosyltransferase involved in cell wall biosynthesis
MLTYAIVTPVRNEAENLRRLAASLEAQHLLPTAWIVVDTGSTDRTLLEVAELAAGQPWVSVLELPGAAELMRGGPIVRAFHEGLRLVPASCDIVVKLDADISMDPDHFERLVEEFERDDRLGIAGGIGYEQDAEGVWRQRHGTGVAIWGACRAYRRACLDEILPLEERMGWDTIDLVAANVHGWETKSIPELPFLHHRVEGERDPSRFSFYAKQGDAAHYMGYRLPYLAFRVLYRAVRDPRAIGIAAGYGAAALRRHPRCEDRAIREYVRREQRILKLRARAREAMRHRAALDEQATSK